MHFISIIVRKDNLMYLFFDELSAFSVDAFNPKAILHALSCDFKKQLYTEREILELPKTRKSRILSHTLTTHNHQDHSGGNETLRAMSPDTTFISSWTGTQPYSVLKIGSYSITSIPTPCHTECSYTYLVHAPKPTENSTIYSSDYYLLTGDFLFRLGCGRFFYGNSKMFLNSLRNVLNNAPDSAILLYGHDYNESFSKFVSMFYDPLPAGFWLSLAEEKEYNPFINYQRACGDVNGEVAIKKLRDMRDATM
ncbi:hydroxyacylglutathione hydrolase [Pancytospora epiphaga]|nr:hydroxyacylglutathione hydrolase [Pancytospora epiphaga]